jgi:hypothetical protein
LPLSKTRSTNSEAPGSLETRRPVDLMSNTRAPIL